MRPRFSLATALAGAFCLAGTPFAATISNPFIHADIPDLSIVAAGGAYYMVHTTMHFAPGVPVMKSTDLSNWRIVGHAYQTLLSNNQMNLEGGSSAYGKGSWDSSFRYKDGTFYVLTPSYTSNKTHLYSTTNVEKGPWKEVQFPFYHDPSLHLDADGRNFVVYGGTDIKLVQLNSGLTGTQGGGINKTIISGSTIKNLLGVSNPILVGEGSHIEKINNYYYVFLICWPNAAGYNGRTELVFRSKTIDGNYEGKVALSSNGVAQGSVFQDKAGKWWGYLFQDNGPVGRSPWIMPVTWQNDWPVFNGGTAPKSVEIPDGSAQISGHGIATSDDFSGTQMKLEWQWNHNPDNKNWSLTARPGFYRITTGRTDAGILSAKNTLTHRSFGPKCSGRIGMDASGMKDGDIAGLVALADSLGFVGVRNNGGSLQIVKFYKGNALETTAPLGQKRVFFRIDMDFGTKLATFYYGTDSTKWTQIGKTMRMNYTLGMFVGYRFGLFNYATKAAGGYADFDWFQIGSTASETIQLPPLGSTSVRDVVRFGEGLRAAVQASRGTLDVRYDLPSAGRVEVSLHDLSGRQARSLDLGLRTAGAQAARLDVTGLAEGRYVLVARHEGRVLGTTSIALTK